MRGPGAKGHAEMAVSRVKGSGPETPAQTPDQEGFNFDDFQDQQEVCIPIVLYESWCNADLMCNKGAVHKLCNAKIGHF